MKIIDSSIVKDRLHTFAFNSSHYVWLIADFTFLESTTGWIFAVTQKWGVLYVGLEPLPPSKSFTDQLFKDAIAELEAHFPDETIAWIAIGSRFTTILNQLGYVHLTIGKEPWVDLANYEPTGKKSRGVRAARNQAIRAKASIEKWKISDILKNPTLRQQVDQVHHEWKHKTLISFEGFLLKTDPWALPEDRICFIAKNANQVVEALLIATPIVENESWYFEDLLLDYHHTRGVGELLILDAMDALKKSGAKQVSLGLVALKELGFLEDSKKSTAPFPNLFSKAIVVFEKTLRTFYNAHGIMLFRKRFNIAKWTPVYIAVKQRGDSKLVSLKWVQVLLGLTAAFQPKFYFFNLKALGTILWRKMANHPISITFALTTGVLFAKLNHFGDLPEHYIRKFSFDLQAPSYEWFYRTITSDLLFFDPGHFLFLFPIYTVLLYALEKTQKLKFAAFLVIGTHFLDDFINYFFIVKPFHFLQSTLYYNLVSFKDVGCSLGMVTVLGFLVNTQLKRMRELVLILVALGLVFGYAFHSHHFSIFILNLNHFLFFLIGYLIGKVKYEMMRKQTKKTAKNKSPYIR